VHETAPSLIGAIRENGLDVLEVPLLVLDRSLWRPPEAPVALRRLEPDDAALPGALAVAEVGFRAPGTRPGPEGHTERDEVALAAALVQHMGERLRTGQSVIVVAEMAIGPVATGTLRPVGDVAEIVGVATLPALRRQGLGGAVTGALVEIALEQGIELVFLSAASDEIARVYERLGFRRAATACFLR
jgi:predicted GNAT family acetyltransferase